MPISIDEFETHDPDDRTNAEQVIDFLARNRDKAYKPVEIAEATGVVKNSIHPVLNRLEDRGLVRHKEPYWALGDSDRVRNAAAFGAAVDFLDDTLGTERRDEWLTAARESSDGSDETDGAADE